MATRMTPTVRQRTTGWWKINVGTGLLGNIWKTKLTKSENGDRKGESKINAAEKETTKRKEIPVRRMMSTEYPMYF